MGVRVTLTVDINGRRTETEGYQDLINAAGVRASSTDLGSRSTWSGCLPARKTNPLIDNPC